MFICKKCNKSIIPRSEEIFMLGRKWHRKCWSCDACGKSIGYKGCTEILDKIYCNECHLGSFGPREIGYFMTRWNRETKERSLENTNQKDQLLFL